MGPQVATAIGGAWYTLAAGAEALVLSGLFLLDTQPGLVAHRSATVVLLAVAGVTAAGMLASWARDRRDRQLAWVRLVAEGAQRVVLRSALERIGAMRFAVRYVSAPSQARVGGDRCGVVAADGRVRLVIGDAEGKGLPALQSAAEVLGVFREAAALTRMGLRACEIAALTLEDVDWRSGVVLISGKGGRRDQLPLPGDVAGRSSLICGTGGRQPRSTVRCSSAASRRTAT